MNILKPAINSDIFSIFSLNNSAQNICIKLVGMKDEFSNLVHIYKDTAIGVFLASATGKLIDYNDNVVRVLGYDSRQDLEKTLSTIFSEVQLQPEESKRIVNEIIKKKDICIYELKVKKKDKSIIDTKFSVKIYNNSPANEIYFVGLMEDVTEQKARDEKGRINEIKYKDLFENSSDSIFFIKGKTVIEFNKKTRELFSIPKTIESFSIFDICPEKQPDGSLSKAKVEEHLKKAETGIAQKLEWIFKSYNEERRYCEVSFNKLSSIENNYFHVIVHDISDRVLTEQKLKQSKEWYSFLIDAAPVGILRTNIEGEILFLNKKLAEIGGFQTRDGFLHHFKRMHDIYKNKKDRDFIIGELAKGKIVNTRLDVMDINNKTMKVNIIASPIINKEGIVDNIVTIVEDITDKVKLEQQIKKRDEMLISVVNSFPFELYVTDLADNLIIQNEFSKKMLGEFVGENVDDLPISPDAKKLWKEESKRVKKNEFLDYEITVERGGEIYQLRRLKTPLIGNDEIIGVITMSIDITERIQLQKEIERHRDNLEYLVKKRTKEVRGLNDKLRIANEEMLATNQYLKQQKVELEELVNELQQTQQQLIQSEKMASIGVLTAGIAHEINNPVNFISSGLTGLEIIVNDILEALDEYSNSHCSIKGDCEWKQKFDEVDKTHRISESKDNLPKLIATMRNGVLRTTEIVKGLRTFSRMDVEHMLPSNINELIDSSLIILKNKYKNHIDIIKNYGQIEPINCFPGKLSQVFLNLIMNAIQAIKNNGKIEITTQKIDSLVEVRIKDNGEGIPEELKNKIFDPFFTTKSVGEGTGLGLSIVHSIISEHNGEIEVFSNKNEGTEFRIKLPLEQY